MRLTGSVVRTQFKKLGGDVLVLKLELALFYIDIE